MQNITNQDSINSLTAHGRYPDVLAAYRWVLQIKDEAIDINSDS
jgi:hypothetical protein